ncbi:uncharacterized protein [Solanum lycopersicum]|uniref:uncharacterized protein n=1 Tax=Solanum lycopersicum TaxID=4081 RepID=UPI00374A17B3
MARLSTIVNPCQPGTTPRNTIQNPKNDGHFMIVTTRGGKQTINPHMSFAVEDEVTKGKEVVETSGELVDKTAKEAKVPQKVVSVPKPQPPLLQRLVKKTEDGKYRCFITMLKQLSINVRLIEALEQMCGYAKFMKDMKKEDPSALTVPCTIGLLHFAKALFDLDESINLMPV